GRATIDQIAGQNRHIRTRYDFVHGCYRSGQISRRVEFAHDPLGIRRNTLNTNAEQLVALEDVGVRKLDDDHDFRSVTSRDRETTGRGTGRRPSYEPARRSIANTGTLAFCYRGRRQTSFLHLSVADRIAGRSAIAQESSTATYRCRHAR